MDLQISASAYQDKIIFETFSFENLGKQFGSWKITYNMDSSLIDRKDLIFGKADYQRATFVTSSDS